MLYEDPELGFTILAHGYVGAKGSKPHDHGPSWAIYGQAAGETIMTDWDCLARPTETHARQGTPRARLRDEGRAMRICTTPACCTRRGARARRGCCASRA